MWSPQAHALADAGFRVIVPDLRGMGKAPVGKDAGTMAAFAGDVLRMLERAGVRRYAVGGFSMGGYVAMEVARRASEHVNGLALVDTRAEPDSDEGKKGRAALIERVRKEGAEALVEVFVPKLLTPAAPAPLREQVRATILRTPVEGAAHALEAMASRPDSRPLLATLRVPTLVIVGELDALTPVDAAQAMATATGAPLVVVPGAAHLTTLERPADVTAALLAWARRLQ